MGKEHFSHFSKLALIYLGDSPFMPVLSSYESLEGEFISVYHVGSEWDVRHISGG